VWSPMSAVSFDASSALLGGAPCGTPTRERDKTALCAARHAGSSRLPHCLSPAGKCQFHSGIPQRRSSQRPPELRTLVNTCP